MTSKFMEGGWLREGSDPMDAVARDGAQCTEGDPEYLGVRMRNACESPDHI